MSVRTLSGAARSLLMCEDTLSPLWLSSWAQVAPGTALQAPAVAQPNANRTRAHIRARHDYRSSQRIVRRLCPVLDRHKLQRLGTDIIGRWPDDLAVAALLQHVRAPARGPRHHKQRRKQV